MPFEVTFKEGYTYKTFWLSGEPISSLEQRYHILVAPDDHEDLVLRKYCISPVRRKLQVAPTSPLDALHWHLFHLKGPKSNALQHAQVLSIQKIIRYKIYLVYKFNHPK